MSKTDKLKIGHGNHIFTTGGSEVAVVIHENGSEREECEMAQVFVTRYNSHDALAEALENNLESLVRYGSCLHGYAKESAHKGNMSHQNHWTTKVRANAELIKETKAALATIKEGK